MAFSFKITCTGGFAQFEIKNASLDFLKEMTVDHVSRLITANVPGSPPVFQSKTVGKYVTILLTQVCPRHLPIVTQKLIDEKVKRDDEFPPLLHSFASSSSSSSSYLWFAVDERKEEVD